MANEYMNSNVVAAGMVIPAKQRSKATDFSSAGSDFYGGVGPGVANEVPPRSASGSTANGPSQLVQGIYTQPTGGGRKI
jgi:hypothetical protein